MEILKLMSSMKFSKQKLPEGDDYASLNGLLHERLQDIPQEGDKVEVGNLRIIVEKVYKKYTSKNQN
jgi:Transporter associated domain.